jgi:hypothetical protein
MPTNDIPTGPTAGGSGHSHGGEHRNGNGHVTLLVEEPFVPLVAPQERPLHKQPHPEGPPGRLGVHLDEQGGTAAPSPARDANRDQGGSPAGSVDFFRTGTGNGRADGAGAPAPREAPRELPEVRELTGRGGQGAAAFTRVQPRRSATRVAPARTRGLPRRVTALSILVTAVTLIAAVVTAVDRAGSATVPAQATLVVRADAVRYWNAVTVQAIRDDGSAPTVAARALAIVHTSMYDAWAAYDKTAVGTQLGDQLRRPPSEWTAANKQAAISYAAFRALADLYPDQKRRLEADLRHLGYDPAQTGTDPATAAGVGNRAAAAVLRARHHDGANQLGDLAPGAYADYTGYQPANRVDTVADPASWQPLRLPGARGEAVEQQFVTPHFSRVTPFALRSPDQFRPPPPAPVGSLALRREVAETLQLSASLGDRDKALVEYWSGGRAATPAVQWAQFAQWTSQRDRDGVDQDVKTFFALSGALLDAAVAAWDALTAYDSARPVTAVPRVLGPDTRVEAWAGPYQASRWIAASDWRPYQPATVVSPAYAGYPSDASVIAAAGAAVLRLSTGSDRFGAAATVRAGSSTVEPGVVPHKDVAFTWRTFSEAARYAGLAQRLAGTAFATADARGQAIGRQVGAQAFARAAELFEGTAATNPA